MHIQKINYLSTPMAKMDVKANAQNSYKQSNIIISKAMANYIKSQSLVSFKGDFHGFTKLGNTYIDSEKAIIDVLTGEKDISWKDKELREDIVAKKTRKFLTQAVDVFLIQKKTDNPKLINALLKRLKTHSLIYGDHNILKADTVISQDEDFYKKLLVLVNPYKEKNVLIGVLDVLSVIDNHTEEGLAKVAKLLDKPKERDVEVLNAAVRFLTVNDNDFAHKDAVANTKKAFNNFKEATNRTKEGQKLIILRDSIQSYEHIKDIFESYYH